MATTKKLPKFDLDEAKKMASSAGYTGDNTKVICAIWYLSKVNKEADATELLEVFPGEDKKGTQSPMVFARSLGQAKEIMGLSSGSSSSASSASVSGRTFALKIDGKPIPQATRKAKALAELAVIYIEKKADIPWLEAKELLAPKRGRKTANSAVRNAEITAIRNLADANVALDVIALSFKNWSKASIEELLAEDSED